MGASRGRYGICVKFSWQCVTGVGGAVHGGQSVRIHHNISGFLRVQAAGRGRGSSSGSSESTSSTATPGPRGLLGALGFGPACGSST